MKITIKRAYWGFRAYWGDDLEMADYWGEGRSPECAVRDLLDNYDIPKWLEK